MSTIAVECLSDGLYIKNLLPNAFRQMGADYQGYEDYSTKAQVVGVAFSLLLLSALSVFFVSVVLSPRWRGV